MDDNGNVVLKSFRPIAEPVDSPSLQLNGHHLGAVNGSKGNDAAIEVLKLRFSYEENEPILSDLNMIVPRGSIFGLLGASGCGKTTLIKCIIGMIPADRVSSGFISVFGKKPGTFGSDIPGKLVGYMPQDVALYADLTIAEILLYFGRLYFMCPDHIRAQIKYLCEILDLPDARQVVGTLSGGQMRRASFAAALIHEPPLVVLDEPTAGVDPILRANVWRHLRNMCQQKQITILFSTHYIDEARSADLVAFMRKGQILTQDSPDNLLLKYQTSTLEHVFLELCTARKRSKKLQRQLSQEERTAAELEQPSDQMNLILEKEQERDRHTAINYQRNHSNDFWLWARWWYHMFVVLLWKNCVRSIRHPLLIGFQYVLPLVQIILFCICIGGDPFDIKVGIVNEESPANLSQLFIDNLDPFFIQKINLSSLEEGKELIRTRQLWGVIHIGENFTEAIVDRMDLLNGIETSNETIKQSRIMYYADVTDKLITISIERSLLESYQSFIRDVFEEFDLDPVLVSLPIRMQEPVYGTYRHKEHKGYRDYMAPGLLVSIIFAVAYSITIMVLVLEREEKTFERNFVTGVTASQIIIAHAFSRLIFMCFQVVIVLGVVIFVFGIETNGSYAIALSCALLLLQNVLGVAYGMLISAVCRQPLTAVMVAVGTLFFTIQIGGVIWPVSAIPLWFQWFSKIQPNTIPVEALRSIIAKGWHLADLAVLNGFGVTLIWIVLLFMAGIKLFRYE